MDTLDTERFARGADLLIVCGRDNLFLDNLEQIFPEKNKFSSTRSNVFRKDQIR